MDIPISYWEHHVPLFGIIAPFISGVLILIGLILGVKFQGREEVILPIEQIKVKANIIPTAEVSPISGSSLNAKNLTFNFCPECGYKIKIENSRFCVNYGFGFNQ
ncbi:MAG: zinc ribbon domain-containing protein [Promethearchaeota archaeon]|jgi:hypothetical protein